MWWKEEVDEEYDELIYEDEEIDEKNEEDDGSAMYFDVPLPYRPSQNYRRKRT